MVRVVFVTPLGLSTR